MILYLILGEVMQRKIFWFILLLFMGLILNGCGGGDKEESDSITFISDSTIYVKKSEIKKFEFPIQATSKLNSRLEFQLKGEDAKFFKLNTLNGILIFNIYYYNRGEIKSTYKIDIVASVVEGSVINNTTTIINKKSSKLSKKQSITIIIGEKPTSVVVVPVVSTPTPIAPLLTPTSKTMTKGYLIDAPIAGVNYSCGIKSNLIRGKTTLTGEFSCEVTPVVFSIGDYFLGTLNEFTLDSKVYPQDLLEISRDNFNDTRLIKMIRLLQSLDDDGDISDVITISSRVADKFKEYTNEFDLETLVSLADKELISENDALLHLRANIPTPTPYVPTPTPYVPTPTPYVPTPTPYVPTPTPYVPTPTLTPYIPTPTPYIPTPTPYIPTPTPEPITKAPSSTTIAVKKTGQTTSYEPHDDGFYQKGVANNYSRSGEIVTDHVTRLMWQDNEEAKTVKKNWEDAIRYCSELSLGSYNDWRLPSIRELKSIRNLGKKDPAIDSHFENVTSNVYWSSITHVWESSGSLVVNFYQGTMDVLGKSYEFRVRCVRGGQ